MKTFPAPDTLGTLALARETYGKLLSAFNEQEGQISQLQADLQAANELVDESATTLTQTQTDLKAKSAALEQATHDLGSAKENIRTLEAKVAKLESEAKSAESKAAEICASVGVEPVAMQPEGESRQRDLMAEFRAINDPAKQMAFFRKHKNELLSRQSQSA